MKAVCISACEVDKLGIVTAGEEVELPDALANDGRINQHFVIDRATIKDPNAKLPDSEKDYAERRDRFEKSLQDESEWMKALNVIIDSGREVPADIIEEGRLTKDEKIVKLADLWIEDFGYVFPSDPKDPEKNGKGSKPKGPKGPKGGAGDKGQPGQAGASAEGDKPGSGEEGETGDKDNAEDDLFGGKK